MQLTIVWHKPCWRAPQSPTGFAVQCCLGHPEFVGLSGQVEALALRSYEQVAFRRMLLPSEQWDIKIWRAFTGRVATPEDVRMTR